MTAITDVPPDSICITQFVLAVTVILIGLCCIGPHDRQGWLAVLMVGRKKAKTFTAATKTAVAHTSHEQLRACGLSHMIFYSSACLEKVFLAHEPALDPVTNSRNQCYPALASCSAPASKKADSQAQWTGTMMAVAGLNRMTRSVCCMRPT